MTAPRSPRSTLVLVFLALASCATAATQGVPRAEADYPAALRLVGVVTVVGDTVRFDRPRAGGPPIAAPAAPRVEAGEVVATVGGRPYRLPVERVAVWLHQEPGPERALLVASLAGVAIVGATLAYVLSGGFD